MPDQKPGNIKNEDWTQTPLTVRALLAQSSERIGQLEAQIESYHRTLQPYSEDTAASLLPQSENDIHVGHLLVVDDNEMNRDLLSRRLIRQGHTVDVAVNGRQALEMIKTQKFDLVLLDIMMPEMNGYEVLEHMKADSTLPYVPVIMISAVDEIDSVVRCIELGAEDYLPKPFNRVLLKARIGASIEKKRLRDRQEAYTHQLDIENQRKSDELEQARKIQLAMLPTSPPADAHIDLAAHQETASEVGGDYYDFFPQTDGGLRIALGDATGHGAGSGLMVSMTKASLLAAHETDLIALVGKINTILNEIDLGLQLNMALMVLEVGKMEKGHMTVRISGGGMPPIFVLRARGGVDECLISGLPLGIIDEAIYEMTEIKLQSGDVMLLMSDGVVERFNTSGQYLGFDRLSSALALVDIATLTAAQILENIAQIGASWAEGQPLHDDVTIVVMKVK